MGLKRGEKVLDYLIDLNEKQPVEQMNRAETEELLKALGWKEGRDFDQACHQLMSIIGSFSASKS